MSTTTVPTTLTGTYTLDPTHSRIGFVARHAMVTKVRGQFAEWTGTAHVDTANPAASKVELSIKTASIDTGSADRDGHLTSADFFDAEANPEITFVSTDVSRSGDDWTIAGDLTIKGITRPVSVDFELEGSAVDPYGNLRIGLEGATTINRKDFGVSWNAALETGGVLVGEKVVLEFEVSAVKAG